MMNFKDFPVVSTDEFKCIRVDVVLRDDAYIAVFNFFKKIGKKKNSGFTWASYLSAASLDELYIKVDTLFELGLFNGSSLSGTGTLYNEDYNEICDIDWNSYGETIDITGEIVSAARILH